MIFILDLVAVYDDILGKDNTTVFIIVGFILVVIF